LSLGLGGHSHACWYHDFALKDNKHISITIKVTYLIIYNKNVADITGFIS